MEKRKTKSANDEHVLDSFRRWGYLQAQLDPLGLQPIVSVSELDVKHAAANVGRKYYCDTIGVEFMHIPDVERREWIQSKMEQAMPASNQGRILEYLVRAEVLEQVMHIRYPGTKRFSLEGLEALIPLLDEVLTTVASKGVTEAVMGMSHRGRLNVMVQIVGKSAVDIFSEFEDVDPRSVLGAGDVKYHIGATGDFVTRDKKTIRVRLVSNPSHLEAVDPVVVGRVRAKQTRMGAAGTGAVMPIIVHGDAAFAGQGITAEMLNLASVDGFSVGGTIHIVANNQIGFTASPKEYSSSRFATDVAKRLPIPIFHVNGGDPEAVVRVAAIAAAYRCEFASSVVIDLIGFRRHGHSEVDDPTITQPLVYKKIETLPPLWKTYALQVKMDGIKISDRVREEYGAAKDEASTYEKKVRLSTLPDYWADYEGGKYYSSYEVDTAITRDEFHRVVDALVRAPANFAVHPKVKRLLDQRKRMGEGDLPVDFGTAELIAFGSLLKAGVPVRMSGQDSRRGTFSHRHAVLIDVENEQTFIPLQQLATGNAWFEIYNSVLSEAAVMGFEYGFSRDYPDALVLWEAQFGDFANGAQMVIDQFIGAAEDKWDLLSGLVLLLPHGFEGQGPEHSSARVERFLQLAAEDNIQVCQPTTAAQYFHLLRRQALRKWRKPLIVFTPKSMLRLADAASAIEDFTGHQFMPVLPETEIRSAERVLVCTGKIGRELRRERSRLGDDRTAIVFVEQLYPFPERELRAELDRHADAVDVIWVQEEPGNMGALSFMMPRLRRLAGERHVRSIKRSPSAGVATGSAKAHEMEQTTLLSLAFAGSPVTEKK